MSVISTKLFIKISKYTKELSKTEKSLFNSPWKVKCDIYDEIFVKVYGMDRHKYMDKMYEKRSNWNIEDEDDEQHFLLNVSHPSIVELNDRPYFRSYQLRKFV